MKKEILEVTKVENENEGLFGEGKLLRVTAKTIWSGGITVSFTVPIRLAKSYTIGRQVELSLALLPLPRS
ncbi:MAG: hypothetical protein ACTHLZ_13540 [Tepidisphaeraceae bacterium]